MVGTLICAQCWQRADEAGETPKPSATLAVIPVQDIYQKQTDTCADCGCHP